jgi:hypothetical protein
MNSTDPTSGVAPAAQEPAAQEPAKQKKVLPRWVTILAGVVAMFAGGVQIYKAFVPDLPGCTADTTNAAIHDIFKQKNVELSSLTDFKTLTDTSSEKTCQADFLTPAEKGTINYRISWQDRSALVVITSVDTHPR